MTLLVSFGLAFPLAPSVAAQGAAAVATSEARASLSALTALLDPATYDVDALALDLAFEDADAIAEWVRLNIAYEVYAGLLRGPQGTLVAGAGNALDQSVLLARLLNDAGYDARVALATLDAERARTLALSMFDVATAASADTQADHSQELVEMAVARGADAATVEAALRDLASVSITDTPAFQEANEIAGGLLTSLPGVADSDATDELVSEARQYAWVEYRLGPSDEWANAHPAWPAASDLPELTVDVHLESEVPAEMQHRLRLEMTIERKQGDEFSTEALMTPWERPVANMLGHTITVGNTVLGESGATTFSELGMEAADAAFYAPILNGALAPGAVAFDLRGNVVPPDVASSTMAGVFQTVGGKLGGALGALGAMGTDEEPVDPFALTAQWLDVVLIAPGGEETRYRRTFFDRRTPGARETGGTELLDESVLLDGIITTYSLMAAGGSVSASYVASVMAEQASTHLDALDQLAAQGAGLDEDARSAALMKALEGYTPRDHLQLFAASDAVDTALEATAYRAEPVVLALVGTLTPGAEASATSGVDIIANAKRTVRLEGDAVVRDVEAGLVAGAWDTVVEREFVSAYGRPVANATTGRPAEGWQLVTAAHRDHLAAAGVPSTALSAVSRDLDNGYSVLVPRHSEPALLAAAAAADWHYWRVDTRSGETLGMSASGRGNAMAEFIIGLKVGLAVNSALAVPSLIQCASSDASWTCYCDVIVSGAILSLAGGLVGALVKAEAALVTYAIVDITIVGPVTTLWTPPVCSSFAFDSERRRVLAAGEAACWAA